MEIPIPDHTTLSRRLRTLGEIPFRAAASNRPIHLLIDSTGLRIHVGNLRKPPKKRAWRKLHLAVDANTGEIVASDLTSRRTHDCTRVPVLLEQNNGRVASVSADGAYDTEGVYEAAHAQGEERAVRVLIPPGGIVNLSRYQGTVNLSAFRAESAIRETRTPSIFGQFRTAFDALGTSSYR